MEQKKLVWNGFSWKTFFKYFALFFLLALIIEFIFEAKGNIQIMNDLLTLKYLSREVLQASIAGFLFAFWFEPNSNCKVEKQSDIKEK